MPIGDMLEVALGGQIRRLVQPLPHRRRHVVHRFPRVTAAQRGEWWRGDPHWFPDGTPPRRHNRVTPLIDWDAYFSALYRALTQAQHYGYSIGWAFSGMERQGIGNRVVARGWLGSRAQPE